MRERRRPKVHRVLIFGDSLVRHLDSAFCARDGKRTVRVCLVGM